VEKSRRRRNEVVEEGPQFISSSLITILLPSPIMTSNPTQHKAAFIPEKFAVKSEVRNRDTPKPKDDEVLIKIKATAINPVDWKIRDWGFMVEDYPAIVGSDAAGEIISTGSKVTNVKVGDRVGFQGILGKNDSATFQQYCVMSSDLVGILPSSISYEQAAGVSLASIAVISAFYHEAGADIKPRPWQAGGDKAGNGKSIVIIGGSSSVGQYAIQLAKLSGFSNIVTASSKQHHDHLENLGAHVVLDRNSAKPEDYAEASKAYPLGIALDAISTPESGTLAVQILAAANPNGAPSNAGVENSTMIHLLDVPDEVKQEAGKIPNAKIRLTNTWGISSSPHLRNTSVEFYKALFGNDGYLAKDQIKPNKPLVVKGGLAALDEALAKNKEGVSGVKVVILPNEE
jgi:NADPH:quinone reductase-like Zn-dependent oxidoreductase